MAAAPRRSPAASDSTPLTAPVEDYLKAIYDIQQGGDAATTNVLAERLALAPASVSGMVRRLASQGLLDHEPYRGARLTATGRAAALRTLRRHRVLESYLATVLGIPWDDVHAEAEQLEHAASDTLIDSAIRSSTRTAHRSRPATASWMKRDIAPSPTGRWAPAVPS
jgi:DtxR family Mn-dependent transcriptional regulator